MTHTNTLTGRAADSAPDGRESSPVRVARERLELTQAELAARANLHAATVYNVETGRTRASRSTLILLAVALGEDPAALAAPASPKTSGAGSPAGAAPTTTPEGTRNAARHGRPPRPA